MITQNSLATQAVSVVLSSTLLMSDVPVVRLLSSAHGPHLPRQVFPDTSSTDEFASAWYACAECGLPAMLCGCREVRV
jgi:hypothetical protein